VSVALNIPPNIIQEIKERTDIVSLIREYVPSLKKTGRNWTGLCPFHNDRNPSLSVREDFGRYKCWSCGAAGDTITFIENIEHLDFIEAVQHLARRAGIELNFNEGGGDYQGSKRGEVIQFNTRIMATFEHYLLHSSLGNSARNYLASRGINREVSNTFNLGFVPRNTSQIVSTIMKKGFKDSFLEETGLFRRSDKGLRFLFYDRVIFPIFNHKNECVGFGGRALEKDAKPKYINTPETVVYKKRSTLYGLHTAKAVINEKKKVYIVEGYMDVIGCFRNGLKNVVATCGTALTPEHIKLISRYAEEVVLLMDADEAGIKGIERALEAAANVERIQTRALLLPDGMDPDDFFSRYSLDDFIELEKYTRDGFDFLVEMKMKGIDIRQYQKLLVILYELFSYIEKWESEVVRATLVKRMADLIGIDRATAGREFATFLQKRKVRQFSPNVEEPVATEIQLDDQLKREIDCLLYLLMVPDNRTLIEKCGFGDEFLQNSYAQNLYRIIFNQNSTINKKNLFNYIDAISIKEYIHERLFSDDLQDTDNPDWEKILRNNAIDRISDLIMRYYKHVQADINKQLKLGELYNDKDVIKSLQEEKIVISNEIMKLSRLQELKV
jgi:DNA primase